MRTYALLFCVSLACSVNAKAKSFDECFSAQPPTATDREQLAYQCVIDSIEAERNKTAPQPAVNPTTGYGYGEASNECEKRLRGAGKPVNRDAISNCVFTELYPSPELPPRDPKVIIKNYGIDEVNSAGGVEPYLEIINPNPKLAIKYVDVTMQLYNAVGDRISSEIGRHVNGYLRYTGPLTYEAGPSRGTWVPVWYNYDGSCVQIIEVTVTFMNNAKQRFSGKTLKDAIDKDTVTNCRLPSNKRF